METNKTVVIFSSGHRLGLIVSSSNYPRFDRNPNTGDDFYEEANAPRAVANTLFTDGQSKIILPAD